MVVVGIAFVHDICILYDVTYLNVFFIFLYPTSLYTRFCITYVRRSTWWAETTPVVVERRRGHATLEYHVAASGLQTRHEYPRHEERELEHVGDDPSGPRRNFECRK